MPGPPTCPLTTAWRRMGTKGLGRLLLGGRIWCPISPSRSLKLPYWALLPRAPDPVRRAFEVHSPPRAGEATQLKTRSVSLATLLQHPATLITHTLWPRSGCGFRSQAGFSVPPPGPWLAGSALCFLLRLGQGRCISRAVCALDTKCSPGCSGLSSASVWETRSQVTCQGHPRELKDGGPSPAQQGTPVSGGFSPITKVTITRKARIKKMRNPNAIVDLECKH